MIQVDKPLVSIVVAIYKSERFLDKLITSIIRQTYPNLDVILVDDGSPDESGAVCDRYAAEDHRIRVIHKPNGGTCDARNKGIELARGEYLVIIDGDDWLAPDYIEYLLRLIQRPGVNMSMTDSVFTTRDLKQNEEDKVVDLTSEEAIAEIIYPWIPIGPWNKMYSMKSLKDAGITFSTKWSGEGLYYATMAAQAAGKVAMGHRRIYYYRLDNENSGLTHYNVEMGTNALENIKFIKDKPYHTHPEDDQRVRLAHLEELRVYVVLDHCHRSTERTCRPLQRLYQEHAEAPAGRPAEVRDEAEE